MNGSQRREQIVRQIQESKEPVSGKKLAELYGVSRQVIVQDIALIRTAGYDIISTNRGYILNTQKAISRCLRCSILMSRRRRSCMRLWIWEDAWKM